MSKKSKKGLMQQLFPAEGEAVPELRFPEFRGAWTREPLCKIGEVLPGYGFPEELQGKAQGEYPFYKVSDISNAILNGSHFIDKAAHYINEEDLALIKAKTIPMGTTIFAKIGEAIRLNRRVLTTSECLIDNNVAGVKAIPGKANDLYIFYVLSQVNLIEYSGGVVPSCNKSTLENISVFSAELEEQQKIADCLSSLDNLITAQAQKIESLKDHKKGLMQQLFPAEGEAVPKLRFPEFRGMGGWENKSIGEVTTVIAGATPSTNNPNYWGGDIPWMNSGELNLKRVYKVSNGITALGLKETSTKLIPLSCILIGLAGQGKTRGTVAINYIELCTNQSIATILPNIYEFVSEFLFHKLDSMYFYLRSLSKGEGGRGGLNLQIIKSVKISLPRLEEQKKIADCLSSLDNLITAQAQKIESLKDHKKGLMQQLFPTTDEVEQ
ncbi:type I restriction enzyme, S subunit [Bathymodiolus platifrons methanotrophic gill symbiont]|uniref:restriction endonuclease subunit S n=1 Tax=Bathymodiolus platifrons methanotrophic gill symbiont TaxID=113268 RepID=UPI00142D853F|nr:restriction endonuclease subunit S [Bathymodiolus platifrons methanotrophic gill symbiont]GFO76065.1 type I restriction enzyme, S subunit [Bathymodiolus platifrons methanotrophic gill symbiont]GFO76072.1 type I restriction enzyme, S subunit [Bathymodiolus platifrons methanotrophic gill symbiont]